MDGFNAPGVGYFADNEAIVLFLHLHDGTRRKAGFVKPFAREADEGNADVMAIDVSGASYLVLGSDGEETFGGIVHIDIIFDNVNVHI